MYLQDGGMERCIYLMRIVAILLLCCCSGATLAASGDQKVLQTVALSSKLGVVTRSCRIDLHAFPATTKYYKLSNLFISIVFGHNYVQLQVHADSILVLIPCEVVAVLSWMICATSWSLGTESLYCVHGEQQTPGCRNDDCKTSWHPLFCSWKVLIKPYQAQIVLYYFFRILQTFPGTGADKKGISIHVIIQYGGICTVLTFRYMFCAARLPYRIQLFTAISTASVDFLQCSLQRSTLLSQVSTVTLVTLEWAFKRSQLILEW